MTNRNYGALSTIEEGAGSTGALTAASMETDSPIEYEQLPPATLKKKPMFLMLLIAALFLVIGLDVHRRQGKRPDILSVGSRAGGMFHVATSDYEEPLTLRKYFEGQPVDHFDPSIDDAAATWSHPYFTSETYFAGPGHPIFVILGGEGPIHGILYPYVSKRMAKEFGAYVLQTEHRFYGASQPVGDNPTTEQLLQLFTPEQAIADYIRIIQALQEQLGCSPLRASKQYCPIVTIGASYPGFLSAIMRMRYDDVVDIGWAASAPMILNAHEAHANTNAYFNKVARVAEVAYPGCIDGTYRTLEELHTYVLRGDSVLDVANDLGMCMDTLPEYLQAGSLQDFAIALTQLVVNVNADMNMAYYPPTSDKVFLPKACAIFAQDDGSTAVERYSNFLKMVVTFNDYHEANPSSYQCFDVQTQLADGNNPTIASADWTGSGAGQTGTRWEFQVCKDLVIKTGIGATDVNMFYPPRPWTMEWLTSHCQSRFGPDFMAPEEGRMNDVWNFDDLSGVNKLLFTNGERDGWSVGSYMEIPPSADDATSIAVMNFPNGSHHSELSHEWPREGDTEDILKGRDQIIELLRTWLS
jgi:hypothetical protein